MSEHGERDEPRVGEDGDWWSQLYDSGAPDAGGSSADDTIDDRFAAARAVGASRRAEPAEADGTPDDGPRIVEAPPPAAGPRPEADRSDPREPPGRADTAPERAEWLDRLFGPGPAEEDAAEENSAETTPTVPRTLRRDPARRGEDRAEDAGVDGADVLGGSAPAPRAGGTRWRGMRLGDHSRHGGRPGVVVPPRGRLAPPEPGMLVDAPPGALSDLAPDTVLDGARHGPLVLRAASARGGSARQRGEPRGDALITARFGTGASALLFVAVAVGVGAAPAGRRAAREICQSIGEAVGRSRPRLLEDITHDRRATLSGGLKRLTDRSYGRLRAQAAALGLAPEEYHADLRCLLVPTDAACRVRVVFGAGGGGLFRLRGGRWADLELQVDDTSGERPPAVPARLPDPRDPETGEEDEAAGPPAFRFRATTSEPGDALLLCSAGLAVPLRGDPTFADQLASSWSTRPYPPDLATFLTDVQHPAPAYGDDRTAVTLWHAAP